MKFNSKIVNDVRLWSEKELNKNNEGLIFFVASWADGFL